MDDDRNAEAVSFLEQRVNQDWIAEVKPVQGRVQLQALESPLGHAPADFGGGSRLPGVYRAIGDQPAGKSVMGDFHLVIVEVALDEWENHPLGDARLIQLCDELSAGLTGAEPNADMIVSVNDEGHWELQTVQLGRRSAPTAMASRMKTPLSAYRVDAPRPRIVRPLLKKETKSAPIRVPGIDTAPVRQASVPR